MKNILSKANTKVTVAGAAGLLATAGLVSSLLGLFRERLLLANFGVGAEVDAYKAAFTVPDFMFFVLVSGAFGVTFIPVFTKRISNGKKNSAWNLSSSVLNFLALVTAVASLLIIIFARPLIDYVIAPGFDQETAQLAANMMRIIAINPFLFAISSVLTSMQQAYGRFFFFSLAPSLYSVGIIFGILFLAPEFGIVGVAYGVAIGSVVQLLASLVGMVGINFRYTPKIYWKNKGFRRVLQLLPPRSFDQGIDYFHTLVEVNLASRLSAGMVTAYQTAFTLHWVPITLIGVAISTAGFPKLSERLHINRPDLFKKDFLKFLRAIIWLALPTVVIAYFCRGYLVRLLVAEGNPVIATLLGLLTVAMFFRAIFHLVTRAFYAQENTKTPLYVSAVGIPAIILLASYLASEERYGVYGLAIAQSLIAVFEVVVLLIILSKSLGGLFSRQYVNTIAKMISAAGLSGLVTYILVAYIFPLQATDRGFFVLAPKFLMIVSLSLATYVFISSLFNLDEPKPIIKRMKQIIFRPIKIN